VPDSEPGRGDGSLNGANSTADNVFAHGAEIDVAANSIARPPA
jgi:hypothetical protein